MTDAPIELTGDALLAVTGVRAILGGKPKRITVADKDKAEMLPREIRRACRRFLDDPQGKPRAVPSQKPFDYQKALDSITAVIAEETGDPSVSQKHVEAIMNAFRGQDNELAVQYANAAKRVLLYLQSVMPVRVETMMARSYSLDPSDAEVARFRRAFDIANDPLVVLRDMEYGMLIPDQVTHLKAMYPQGHEAVKAAMEFGWGQAMARKKSWRLSYRRDRQVQILFETDTTPPGLASELQANYAAAQSQPGPGPKPSPPSKTDSKAADQMQTRVSEITEGATSD